MTDLTGYSIAEFRELYIRKEIKPIEVVQSCLDEIDSKDTIVKAFLHVFHKESRKRAKELEKLSPADMPLYGVPVAVKDNICTAGLPTTCASRILSGYSPPYDATVITRLIEAGAVIIGKTNLDEFAMGSSTENSAFQVTRNPWNEECVPGGSSGGSSAAVAAGMVPVALGSDTGGSIRQPASFCGIVGLKGTYGMVSRYGLVAFASSLDQIGPMTKDVRDCSTVMQVIAGNDPKDATTLPGPGPDLIKGLDDGVEGMKIVLPAGLKGWQCDESNLEAMEDTIGLLRAGGAQIDETELPDMETTIACYYILANAEASSNLARFDGVRYGCRAESESLREMYDKTRGQGFGEEVKRRILLGTYVLSSGYYDAYYSRALRVKRMIFDKYAKLFNRFGLIVMPTTPTPAFEVGEKTNDPVSMYLSDIFTTASNIAGLPAISIPATISPDGLPTGIQLIAASGEESKLMRAAMVLEKGYRFREQYIPGSGE